MTNPADYRTIIQIMHDALRIIDANLNRAGEGLRTVEEFARMALNDAPLCERLKRLRHELAAAALGFDRPALLASRDTPGDVGTGISTESERARGGPADVAAAACRRVAESLRCLEEYGKLISPQAAARFEQIRYELYGIEQEVLVTSPRRARLRETLLHVLVSESLCRRPWLETCEMILEGANGGAPVAIQLREKSLSDRELLDRARRLRDLTAARGSLLIINDRVDVARLAGADGVHLGQDDLPVESARAMGGPTLLIGRSTHSAAQARDAAKETIDYIAVGPMFDSATKPAEKIPGPPLLHEVIAWSHLPVVAIGGIRAERIPQLRCDGRFAVAVSQAIIAAEDPCRETARLVEALRGQLAA